MLSTLALLLLLFWNVMLQLKNKKLITELEFNEASRQLLEETLLDREVTVLTSAPYSGESDVAPLNLKEFMRGQR